MRILIFGAGSLFGRELMYIFNEREIDFDSRTIKLFDESSTVNKEVRYQDVNLRIENFENAEIKDDDVIFIFDNSEFEINNKLLIKLSQRSCKIFYHGRALESINSLNKQVFSILDVNGDSEDFKNKKDFVVIFWKSNLSAMLSPIFNLIQDKYSISDVFVSSFHSASENLKEGTDFLFQDTKKYFEASFMEENFNSNNYKRVAFNLFPQVGNIVNNESEEEEHFKQDMMKILNENTTLNVSSNQIPVFRGTSANVFLKFQSKNSISESEIYDLLSYDEDIMLLNNKENFSYITHYEIAKNDFINISRMRVKNNILTFYCIVDNLRIGGALEIFNLFEKLFILR